MSALESYHAKICEEWGYQPCSKVSSGYETVETELQRFESSMWSEDEVVQEKLIQDVFDIYRSVNLVPITYYDLEGCREHMIELGQKSFKVENKKISVGGTAGQAFSRFWFPNMQDAYTRNDKMVGLKSRFYNDTRLKRAIKICFKYRDEGNQCVMPRNIRRALDLVSGGTIANFKPMNARAIWEHLCWDFGGNLLDFSCGYGGRMLGALSSRMRYHYTGIEPNTKTYEGLNALGELLQSCQLGKGYELHQTPSEDFNPPAEHFDAAFSSPPYFNLETYSDESTQCMNRYNSLDDWFSGYVEPTISMLHRSLVKNGVYAVNIADYKTDKDEFKIVERWLDTSVKIGFSYEDKVDMMLNVRPGVGNNKDESSFKSEGVYIFKKVG